MRISAVIARVYQIYFTSSSHHLATINANNEAADAIKVGTARADDQVRGYYGVRNLRFVVWSARDRGVTAGSGTDGGS